MPSTYTVNLGIEKPATGEQSGTWGDTTNVNFDILDQAINGAERVTLTSAGSSGSPNALQITNGATSDGRNKWIEFYSSGDLGGSVYVQLDPNDAEKIVFVRNSLASSRSILLFQGTYNSGRDLEVPAGVDMVVKFDGGGASAATVTDVFTKLRATEITTPTLTATTADINGGTIDNSVIGGSTAAAVTGTAVVANTSLNIAGDGATVTGIKDEDNMASNSATKLATQQSIKAYVDSQVGTVDTWAEVLANGATSGSTNPEVTAGQALKTNTINETSAGSGVTIDSVLLKDDVVNATDVETGSISANDGTAAATIANSTGNFTITNFISNSVDIGGGAIDGTVIGGASAAAGSFTTLDASGAVDMASTLQVDGVITTSDGMVITTADNTDTLQLISTDADASVGPNLNLYRNSASPADNDILGKLEFTGRNDNSENVIYAQILANALDVSDGSEDTRFDINAILAGTNTSRIRINNTELVVNEDSADLDFRVESDGNANMLFVDAGNNRVGVGVSSPQTELFVRNDVAGPARIAISNAGSVGSTTASRVSFYEGNTETSYIERRRDGSGITAIVTPAADNPVKIEVNGGNELASFTGSSIVLNESGADQDFRVESDGNANMLFVDGGNDRVGVGTTTRANLSSSVGSTAALQVEGLTAANSSASVIRNANSVNGPYLSLGKSRGTGLGGTTIVQSGDQLGVISFLGSDGTDLEIGAQIIGTVNGTPGANDMPGALAFLTTADGAVTPSERMTISSSGAITINGGLTVGTGVVAQDLTLSDNTPTISMTDTDSNADALIFTDGGTGTGALFISADHNDEAAGSYISLKVDSAELAQLKASEVIFNEDSRNQDFRVESDSNTHALFVDAGNNRVGVFTSSPAAPLDIQFGDNANILRGSYASGEDNFFLELDSAIVASGVVGYQFHLKNNGTAYNNTLTLDRGNVGIGVQSADEILHVEKSLGTTLVKTEVAANSIVGFEIQKTGATTSNWRIVDGAVVNGQIEIWDQTNSRSVFNADSTEIVINDTSANLDFRVESDGNDHMLFVDGGANHVNVGTSTDFGGTLNVATTDNSVNLVLACTDTDGNEGPILDFTRDAGNVPSDGDIMGKIRFRNDDTNLDMTNYVELTTVVSDVSNGTEDGQLQFNIIDGGTLRNFAHMTGTTGTVFNEDSNNLDFRVESDNSTSMLIVDAGDDVVLFDNTSFNAVDTGASNGIAIRRSGRIAMSTTNGGNALEFFATGQAGKAGSISVSGTTTTYGTSSDQRLKENIADADDSGELIDAIQVRKFDWKTDGSHQDYGMVAQELQTVAPEAVSAPENPDEMMAVDYSKLVPMLIKEIQTLRARVADLES